MKNHFILNQVQERKQTNFYKLSDTTVYDCINAIYHFMIVLIRVPYNNLLNLSWIKKCHSIFMNIEP